MPRCKIAVDNELKKSSVACVSHCKWRWHDFPKVAVKRNFWEKRLKNIIFENDYLQNRKMYVKLILKYLPNLGGSNEKAKITKDFCIC